METEYTTIFKLNDDGTCIFRDKKYDIQEREDERYIECDGKEYRLIEKEEQIKAVLDSSVEKYYFNCCIFLKETNCFRDKIFDKEIECSGSIFNIKVDFSSSKFQEKTSFLQSIFNKEVYFSDATFDKKANFCESIFKEKTDFLPSTFNKEVDFSDATFNTKTRFVKSVFKKEANFTNCTFNKEANFSESKLYGTVFFTETRIEFFNFSNVETKKDFTIDLSLSQIERFNYESTDFKNTFNSESYLKLKNFALKNNDQKNALNFYKKEMEKYRQEVKKKGEISDKFILSFEKFTSNYGTNPIMLIVSFIFTLIVFIDFTCTIKNMSLILMPCISCLDIISTTILLLNPTSSIEKLNIAENVPLFLEALNFLKNIFFSILIYEVIKSFRKFSRKL